MLNSFSNPALNVAIIGASGGIGRAFINHLAKLDNVATIHAFSRTPAQFKNQKIHTAPLDFNDEPSIESAATTAAQTAPLDLIITATGLLHNTTTGLTPEKSLRDITPAAFAEIIAANTIGPALVAKHFLKHIHKNDRSVFAALSARVGSIQDNQLGGWYAYRASKSALNMVLKTAAIETTRRHKKAVIIGLHPGTVATDLSQPFQKNVADNKLFTPEYATEKMLSVINTAGAEHTGKTFAWDGTIIPY